MLSTLRTKPHLISFHFWANSIIQLQGQSRFSQTDHIDLKEMQEQSIKAQQKLLNDLQRFILVEI